MYKAFFNLQRNPFGITPDPSFLFPTKRHNEALSALYYGVRRRKGFVVVTGEVGTGKTLLVRCLLQVLDGGDVAYAYVFNNRLSPVEFLQYVLSDLGFPTAGKNKGELLFELGSLLTERHQQNLTTVLVVDEAHHLSAELLEEIRLLTNLETGQDKLLQILLVGQPELDQQLDSIHLRQLKQRIALRAHLHPLNEEETSGYIYRRLSLAGANSHTRVIFPPYTIAKVFHYSKGIPRLINTVCENGLITAYARQSQAVLPYMIDEVASDFRLDVELAAPIPQGEISEVSAAANTLLRFYEQFRAVRSDEMRSPAPIPAEAGKHEPHI